MSGQIITICLLVASGIIAFVTLQSTYRSMQVSKDLYYSEYRFADVFASARRIPNPVEARLEAIPGVAQVYVRSKERVRVEIGDNPDIPSGEVVTIPDASEPPLNRIHITTGRMPEPRSSDEALLLDVFAENFDVEPGDTLPVLINGSYREIRVTGLAMSPEYVLAREGGGFAVEPGTFAVIWMRRSAVSAAFDMEGAFNDVVVDLQPGADEATVIDRIDHILKPYGGRGAYGREDHPSHRYISSQLEGQKTVATTIPMIFLGVAAFLVNVVLGRMIELQRGQIATLKAVGYSDLSIGLHYLKLVSLIVTVGAAIGLAIGAYLGKAMLQLYIPYFRFPVFEFQFDIYIVSVAIATSLGAALIGAFSSMRKILGMVPAEAMRPEAPPVYRSSWFDRGLQLVLGPMGRMVVRELRRRPFRAAISILGIALAVAVIVLGRFASDSIERLLELQYEQTMAEDLSVSFREPVSASVKTSLLGLPGVHYVEGIRMVSVRLRAGSQNEVTTIQGFPEHRRLRKLIDRDGREVELPLSGLVLSDILAAKLGISPGDSVRVELLEGDRAEYDFFVSGVVSDMLGMRGYIREEALGQLLRQTPMITSALMDVDSAALDEVERRLIDMPAVSDSARPGQARVTFRENQGGLMLAISTILTTFASLIAVGVVYNNARVTLSMRSRDLASMRVLGFSRSEISTVLLGELAIHVLFALPLGMWLGTLMSGAMLSGDSETFRLSAVVNSRTYAFAAVVTIITALVSGLLVRRKLDNLDLIGVLKTRE